MQVVTLEVTGEWQTACLALVQEQLTQPGHPPKLGVQVVLVLLQTLWELPVLRSCMQLHRQAAAVLCVATHHG